MNAPLVIGLTGGIGSGKSEVARAFAALGVEVADADAAAHAVSARGMRRLRRRGRGIRAAGRGADGELDRAWLRRRVFADARGARPPRGHASSADSRTTSTPRSRPGAAPTACCSCRCCSNAAASCPRVARVLVVDCPEDEQVRRVVTRSGLPPDEVRAIMATQMSRAARLARADDVIDNSGAVARPRTAGGAARCALPRICGAPQAGAPSALEPAPRCPQNDAEPSQDLTT